MWGRRAAGALGPSSHPLATPTHMHHTLIRRPSRAPQTNTRCPPPPAHTHTCSASSRVGLITTAPVPLRGMNLARYSSSAQGIRNASVLPEPAGRRRRGEDEGVCAR